MNLLKMQDDNDDNAPEDIRKAVRQLSFAYRRSAAAVDAAEPGPSAEPVEAATASVRRLELRAVEPDAMAEAVRRAEAVLFAAGQPLSADQVAEALPPGVDPAAVLMTLKKTYAGRGVALAEVGGRWRFQTAADLEFLFVEERQVQKSLSQAALETLAIIAYGQPVTRAEIEAVRGVAVSKTTLDQLLEAGWVRVAGRRKTPGRPVAYGTTRGFLEHFGLETLEMLPGKAELEAEGLLSDVVPEGFEAEAADEETDDIAGDKTRLEMDAAGFVTDFMGEEEAD